jgi:hypothetical protein
MDIMDLVKTFHVFLQLSLPPEMGQVAPIFMSETLYDLAY